LHRRPIDNSFIVADESDIANAAINSLRVIDPELTMSSVDVTTAEDISPDDTTASNPKERHSLTLDQRRALRRWAHAQTTRPSHKACIEWFFSTVRTFRSPPSRIHCRPSMRDSTTTTSSAVRDCASVTGPMSRS
jgi:hypothetical protein